MFFIHAHNQVWIIQFLINLKKYEFVEGYPNEITVASVRENTDFSPESDIAKMLLFSVCAQKKA